MTTPISGQNFNLTSFDTKEVEKERTKTSSSISNGAILTKDTLEIPFEKQISIQSQEAEAGRPYLPPLFQIRLSEDNQLEDLSLSYYEALREQLDPLLKLKLKKDEANALVDRDPDLVALDSSLQFEAQLLAMADIVSFPSNQEEEVLIATSLYSTLPTLMQRQLLDDGAAILHFIEPYLDSIGSNDPTYEALINISNQIKEDLKLLNLNQETING